MILDPQERFERLTQLADYIEHKAHITSTDRLVFEEDDPYADDRENLSAVKGACDLLSGPDATFNMAWWVARWTAKDDCGTVGCLAGWACALFADDRDDPKHVLVLAPALLGLNGEEGIALFDPKLYLHNKHGNSASMDYKAITPAAAAQAVRKCRDGYDPIGYWLHIIPS